MDFPNVYEYLDYRIFLSDWFDAKKKENSRYSHRLFVRQTGQKSPSFLADVIKGRRNLTLEASTSFCRVMKLNRSERRFFLLLVDFLQADSDEEKAQAWKSIAATRRFQDARQLDGEAFEILSHWQYTAVQQLARRSDFRLDPQWIGKNVSPPIPAKQARKAVETLFGAGLLIRDERGRIRATESDLITPAEVLGLAVRNYHRSMLNLAVEAIDRFPARRRNYQGITVAVPKGLVKEISARLEELSVELHAMCEDVDEEPDEVLQINLHVFPLSTERKK